MANSFFTSDLHLGYSKIIQYFNRPFSSVTEMNETLIENWNKKIGRNDNAYVLGDLSFLRPETTQSCLQRMTAEQVDEIQQVVTEAESLANLIAGTDYNVLKYYGKSSGR